MRVNSDAENGLVALLCHKGMPSALTFLILWEAVWLKGVCVSLIPNLFYSGCSSKAQTIGIPRNLPVGHRNLKIIANEVVPFCVKFQGEIFVEIYSGWHWLRFLLLFIYQSLI